MRRKQIVFTGLMLFVMAVLTELGAALTTRVLVSRGYMNAMPHWDSVQVERYFADRNPTLGWGPAVDAQGRVLRLAPTRPDSAFDPATPPCVSTYGDSFTRGSEVGPSATYPAVLGSLLGCRVANYGVSAFGSDQALMLFRAQAGADRAPFVILGHLTENAMRNVNQYRNLLYAEGVPKFKPRFVLRADSLEFVPVPVKTPLDVDALAKNPERYLQHEAFLGRPRREFPYVGALISWMRKDVRFRSRLGGYPVHAPYYAEDHASGALQLTTRILSTFAEEARGRGQRPVVLLIPTGRDLTFVRQGNPWPDQPLADALRNAGVPVIHAGPEMLRRMGEADPCDYFGQCNAHFNVRGYRLLAEVVRDEVQEAVAGVQAAGPEAS